MTPRRPPPRNLAAPAGRRRAWSAHCPHPRLRFTRGKLGRCLEIIESQSGPRPPDGEISLAFLTDLALARLHDDFLNDPAPTDVITFPGGPADDFAGEICVSVDRAAEEAAKRQHPFALELTLYLVHGWLHLAGLDDLTPAGRRQMRQGERRLLAAVMKARALPDFRLRRKLRKKDVTAAS